MRKHKILFFLVLFFLLGGSNVYAEGYEWYAIKEGVTGGINFRQGPSMDSEIVECMILNFMFPVPLFRVVEELPSGWYRVQSNRNGTPRNVEYEYTYFYVASMLLRKVDLVAEKLAVLEPADYWYNNGIDIHPSPHVFSYSRWTAFPNTWKYVYPAVQMTGLHEGPMMQIVQLCCHGEASKHWVVSEFFGIKSPNNTFKKYPKPQILYTRIIYIEGGAYLGSFYTRAKPSILSSVSGGYAGGDIQVRTVGEQGYFYLTDKGKWIFKQCLYAK